MKRQSNPYLEIADLVERIGQLNEIIALHREHAENGSMTTQYQTMREGFMEELRHLLLPVQLEVTLRQVA